MDKLDRGLF